MANHNNEAILDNQGEINMLKDFAWNAFRLTGGLDCYCFYKEVTDCRSENSELLMTELTESNQV